MQFSNSPDRVQATMTDDNNSAGTITTAVMIKSNNVKKRKTAFGSFFSKLKKDLKKGITEIQIGVQVSFLIKICLVKLALKFTLLLRVKKLR